MTGPERRASPAAGGGSRPSTRSRSLEFTDGFANRDGTPNADTPTTARADATHRRTTAAPAWSCASPFASGEHMQRLRALAARSTCFPQSVGQMDALLDAQPDWRPAVRKIKSNFFDLPGRRRRGARQVALPVLRRRDGRRGRRRLRHRRRDADGPRPLRRVGRVLARPRGAEDGRRARAGRPRRSRCWRRLFQSVTASPRARGGTGEGQDDGMRRRAPDGIVWDPWFALPLRGHARRTRRTSDERGLPGHAPLPWRYSTLRLPDDTGQAPLNDEGRSRARAAFIRKADAAKRYWIAS